MSDAAETKLAEPVLSCSWHESLAKRWPGHGMTDPPSAPVIGEVDMQRPPAAGPLNLSMLQRSA